MPRGSRGGDDATSSVIEEVGKKGTFCPCPGAPRAQGAPSGCNKEEQIIEARRAEARSTLVEERWILDRQDLWGVPDVAYLRPDAHALG